MVSDKLLTDWYQGEKIKGARFSLDSAVLVLDGEFKGSKASVISLESLKPEVTYIIETSEGRACVIKECHLERNT